jgi:hypothetical protein
VSAHFWVNLHRTFLEQGRQHPREHDECQLKGSICLGHLAGSLLRQVESGHRHRVRKVGQLAEISRSFPLVGEAHQPRKLPAAQSIQVDQQHHGQGVALGVQRQHHLAQLQCRAVARALTDQCQVFEQGYEQTPESDKNIWFENNNTADVSLSNIITWLKQLIRLYWGTREHKV